MWKIVSFDRGKCWNWQTYVTWDHLPENRPPPPHNVSNDQVILQQILGQRNREIAADLAESNFFELFAAEQVLKPFRAL